VFIKDVRELLERSEEYEVEFEYEGGYEYGGYWDDEEDYILVDCGHLAENLGSLFDEALYFIQDGQFETGLAALDMLTEVSGDAEGDIIGYQELIEAGLMQGNAEAIQEQYALATMIVLRGNDRAEKLLQVACLSGYRFSIDRIIKLLRGREIDTDAFFGEWPQIIMREIEQLEALRPGLYDVSQLGKMLVEATGLQGDAKMAEYAHEYGKTHPVLYCALVESTLSRGDYDDAIKTADTALSVVGSKGDRIRLADLKHEAGKATGEITALRSAAMQGFKASLSLKHFLRLWKYGDEAIKAEAIKTFREKMGDCHDVVHIFFVIGAYGELWDMVKVDKESLGWSSSDKGKAFPLFIALLTNDRPLRECTRLGIEMKMYGDEEISGFIELINNRAEALPSDDRERYYIWCVNEIENRVEGIVRNQHRGSYHKAALLVMSMAETISATESHAAARQYIDRYKAKYPRHRSFLTEVRTLEKTFTDVRRAHPEK
jgi:hypothetical protein